MKHPAMLYLLLLMALPCSLHARNQIVTEHYVVVFETGNEFFANEVVGVAEEIWDNLATAYEILDRYQKIYLYILDPGDFANGYAIASKNTVTIYTTNLNAGIRGTSNWIRNVVTHELSHVFSLKAASKNMLFDNISLQTWSRFRNPDWSAQANYWNVLAPAWWVEGMAQYEAYRNQNDFWDTHRDMFLRMAVLENDLLDYVEMGVFGNRNGFYEEMVYNQGYSMVLYLDSAFGAARVHETAKAKSWFSFNSSLKKATGKNGEALYDAWKKTLRERYGRVAAAIAPQLHEGTLFFDGGFWDQFPSISPDNEQCAFVSNKGYDVRYSHLFIMDRRLKTMTRLLGEDQTVESRIQWYPDGNTLLYSRWNSQAAYLDIYKYDIDRRSEKAITWHARAMDPALSGDGRTIAYIENNGGIQNLVLIDADGGNRRQLTNFNNGTQLFSPCWSPDNHTIVLGIFNGVDRDIAQVCALATPMDKQRKLTDTVFFPESLSFEDDLEFRLLVHSTADERDPCLSPDGKSLYYSSDRTGIFNIYRLDLTTGNTVRVTNVTGGAFHPSVDRDNALVYYTGFHAANYSIYSVAVDAGLKVTVENVERDYAARKRTPYLFSSGADDGTNKLKPYQYPLSPYKPVYTMWDASPFLNFSPAYITDSIGDAHVRGGMQFLFGELSGRASLMGYAYGGKSPKSKAALSWGGGLVADLRLPRIMGQNRMYQPSLAAFGGLDEVRNDEQLKPQEINVRREPYQSLYMVADNDGPDTLISQYLDYTEGSFRSAQRFEEFGISGGLQCNEWNRIDGDLSHRNVSVNGSLLDAAISSSVRIYTLPNQLETRGAKDITNQIVNNYFASTWLKDIIRDNTFTQDPLSFIDEYKDYLIYRDYRSGCTWSYSNVRPAQVLPIRADLFAARAGLASSTYSLGTVNIGMDTTFSSRGAPEPDIVYNRHSDGTPAPFMAPLLQQEHYSSLELSALERFPLWGGKRSFVTGTAFFGALDRKLPEIGSVYPLQYRAGMFLGAYPYSFDPVDTVTIIDSFFVPVVRGSFADSGFVTSVRPMADAIERDILWGNGIMYLNASYTFEVARGITYKPLGLLLQGVYATAFAEGAALWNSDLRDLSFEALLGIDRPGEFTRIGKTFLKDAGARLDIPFVMFENWQAFFSFSWARRLSLDDLILGVDYDDQGRPSRIRRLDKNRYTFTLLFTN